MIGRWFLFFALLASALLATGAAGAHEVRPAYLQIDQDGPQHFVVTWKQPALGDIAIRLKPHLTNGWLEQPPSEQFATPTVLIRSWSVNTRAPDPISGQTLTVEGLDQTITDVLVQANLADGRRLEAIVRPDHPSLVLTFASAGGLPVPAYLVLGVQHILTGTDHLMFVLGLLLLVGIRWRLLEAITAFTVAHSITLALAALGLVQAPSAVVEALVALSIVFVAAELAHGLNGAKGGVTRRYPWLIAFTFGLLHGLAFAGALAEVGLPKDAIPASLFLFNVGVEAGQLMFVAAAILVILALRHLWPRVPANWKAFSQWIPPYAIGCFATYWFIERVAFAFA